jgi:HEAT repeat protein
MWLWWTARGLRSRNAERRRMAAHRLAASSNPRAADHLAAALGDESHRVREAVRQALLRLRTRSVVPLLETLPALESRFAVASPDSEGPARGEVRALVVEVIVGIDDAIRQSGVITTPSVWKELVDWLIESGAASDPKAAGQCLVVIEALNRIGSEFDSPWLMACLSHPAAEVRQGAVNGLFRVGGASALVALACETKCPGRGAVESKLNELGAAVVPSLWQALQKATATEVARRLIRILGTVGPPARLPLAEAVFWQNDVEVRRAAAAAAGIDWPQGRPKNPEQRAWAAVRDGQFAEAAGVGAVGALPLVAALFDPACRDAVTAALHKVGKPAAGPLMEALAHPNAEVRAAATNLLGEVGSAAATGPLTGVVNGLFSEEPHFWTPPEFPNQRARKVAYRAAIRVLGLIGDAGALPVLLGAARFDPKAWAKDCIAALGMLLRRCAASIETADLRTLSGLKLSYSSGGGTFIRWGDEAHGYPEIESRPTSTVHVDCSEVQELVRRELRRRGAGPGP